MLSKIEVHVKVRHVFAIYVMRYQICAIDRLHCTIDRSDVSALIDRLRCANDRWSYTIDLWPSIDACTVR